MSTEFERLCQAESEIEVLRTEITKLKNELEQITTRSHRELESMINWGGTE